MSVRKSKKNWFLLLGMVWLAIILVSGVLIDQFGRQGQVSYVFLKVNSLPQAMPALLIMMNQSDLRDVVLAKANVSKDVAFFMVENIKSDNRMRLSIRFVREIKSGFEEKVKQIVQGYNDLGMTQKVFQEAVDRASDELQFAKLLESKPGRTGAMIYTAEAIYPQSQELAQKKYDELVQAGKLLQIEESIVTSGGKNVKIYLMIALMVVMLSGLTAMVLNKE